MVIIDEIHVVSATFGSTTRRLASANLSGHVDTAASLRIRVRNSVRSDEAADLLAAYDRAFAACEAVATGESRGSAEFPGGTIVVVRSISA